MRRLIALAAALIMICLSAGASKHTVDYYYLNYCESCDPAADFAVRFRMLTGVDLADCEFHAYNVVTASGRRAFEDAGRAFGLTDEALPVAVVDGKVFRGANEMNEKLPPEAMTWGNGTDSQVVYLYTPACESCARAEAALEALPEAVTVKRGALEFSSQIAITRYDVTKETALAGALFDAYDVPEPERVTPAVFLPGRALVGIDEIERNLVSYVSLGWAVGEVSAASGNAAEPLDAANW